MGGIHVHVISKYLSNCLAIKISAQVEIPILRHKDHSSCFLFKNAHATFMV